MAKKLLASWEDGRVKLYLTYKALHFRKAYRNLFSTGEYIPVEVAGFRVEHVCAFARHLGSDWALVVVPRLLAQLQLAGQVSHVDDAQLVTSFLTGEAVWGQSALILPEQAPVRWRNILTGEVFTLTVASVAPSTEGKVLLLADVFGNFPVALLVGGSEGF